MRSKDYKDLFMEHKHSIVSHAAEQFLVNLLPASLCKTTMLFLLKIPTDFPSLCKLIIFVFRSNFSKVTLSKKTKNPTIVTGKESISPDPNRAALGKKTHKHTHIHKPLIGC